MNTKRTWTLLLLLLTSPWAALGDLEWRISVKVILDANGNRPNNITNEDIELWFEDANLIVGSYGRGYRYNLDEIVDLSGVSQWYNSSMDSTTRVNLQTAATFNPTLYGWRSDAMNLYIVREDGGGWCARPDQVNDLMIIGAQPFRFTALHETGHFLGLCHTHGCNSSPETCSERGSDDLADTLDDNPCWDQDEISVRNYGFLYADLSSGQQVVVDDTWQNIMSYHVDAPRLRLTSDQLDRMTDTSNDDRSFMSSGRTWFVDGSNNGNQTGSSTQPITLVGLAIFASSPGDIVLVRSGGYPLPMTVQQHVILRASRGNAVIGASN